jgi:hypothetical protein
VKGPISIARPREQPYGTTAAQKERCHALEYCAESVTSNIETADGAIDHPPPDSSSYTDWLFVTPPRLDIPHGTQPLQDGAWYPMSSLPPYTGAGRT